MMGSVLTARPSRHAARLACQTTPNYTDALTAPFQQNPKASPIDVYFPLGYPHG
jgi:hypothetical protein